MLTRRETRLVLQNLSKNLSLGFPICRISRCDLKKSEVDANNNVECGNTNIDAFENCNRDIPYKLRNNSNRNIKYLLQEEAVSISESTLIDPFETDEDSSYIYESHTSSESDEESETPANSTSTDYNGNNHFDSVDEICREVLPDITESLLPDLTESLLPDITESLLADRTEETPALEEEDANRREILVNLHPPRTSDVSQPKILPSRTGTKKNFCYYCSKLVTKLPRHLGNMHKDEPDVKKFLNAPKGSRERKNILEVIRRKFNFEYNRRSSINEGNRIVCRRPQADKQRSHLHYECCPTCKGYFSKLTLHRHYRRCANISKGSQRNIVVMGRRIDAQIHDKACSILVDKVFPVLRQDEVTDIARYDELIILFANKLCQKYRSDHFYKMIRSRVRVLGRLLLELKKLDETISDLASILHPKYYDVIIIAVNNLANLKENSTYKSPATATLLGNLLKKCATLLITECIKKMQNERKSEVSDFLKLLEEDYGTSVNKTVLETMLESRRHKKIQLPCKDDIQKLWEYLNKNREKWYQKLKSNFTYESWINLASYTLISLQVFNRRRAGEVERIKIEDYKNYESLSNNLNKDMIESISKEEQKSGSNYIRFAIRGKLGREVPVLLHKKLNNAIQLLLRHRNDAKVNEDNPYLFGLPNSTFDRNKHLSCCILLKKYAELCGAKNPNLLRGTQLRKHLATRSATLKLSEIEIADLANYMGHDVKIHRDVYRVPLAVRELTGMSKLLEDAQGQTEETFVSSDEESDDELTCETNNMYQENEKEIRAQSSNILERSIGTKNVSIEDAPKKRKTRSVSPIGTVKRVSWTSPERNLACKLFKDDIINRKLPTKSECFAAIASNSILHNRSVDQLYAFVNNQMKKHDDDFTNDDEKRNKKSRAVMRWRTEEKQIVRKFFAKNFETNTNPKLDECEYLIKNYPIVLKNRTAQHLKSWVYYEIKRNIKNATQNT